MGAPVASASPVSIFPANFVVNIQRAILSGQSASSDDVRISIAALPAHPASWHTKEEYLRDVHMLRYVYGLLMFLSIITIAVRAWAARYKGLSLECAHVCFLALVLILSSIRIVTFSPTTTDGIDKMENMQKGHWVSNMLGTLPMVIIFTMYTLLNYHVAVVLRSIRITYAAAFDEAAGPENNLASRPEMCVHFWFLHRGRPYNTFLVLVVVANLIMWGGFAGLMIFTAVGLADNSHDAAFLFTALLFVPSVAMSAILGVSFIVSGVLLARRLQDLRRLHRRVLAVPHSWLRQSVDGAARSGQSLICAPVVHSGSSPDEKGCSGSFDVMESQDVCLTSRHSSSALTSPKTGRFTDAVTRARSSSQWSTASQGPIRTAPSALPGDAEPGGRLVKESPSPIPTRPSWRDGSGTPAEPSAAGTFHFRDGGASIGLRHEIIGGLSGSYMEVGSIRSSVPWQWLRTPDNSISPTGDMIAAEGPSGFDAAVTPAHIEPVLIGVRRMLWVISVSICAFIFRALVIVVVAVWLDMQWPPWLFLIYMVVVEVSPSALLLVMYCLPGVPAKCWRQHQLMEDSGFPSPRISLDVATVPPLGQSSLPEQGSALPDDSSRGS
mmetsp:Transcript_55065/g.128851  ORF Transcript_55065/g.128851 Transcript_55065/m.128851 type:complete len:609 (-) Transcript_55065:30-1856(-)